MNAPSPPQVRPPQNWPRSADIALRVAGGVVGLWGGVLLGIYATLMTPFRVGGVLVPLSLVLAVGGNAVLIWFSHFTTRNKFAALLPGLAWAAFSFLGANRTSEGDLVLTSDNWVATTYLFVGAITVGISAYRVILPKPTSLVPPTRR